jgi:hypothetical protein
MIFPYYMKRCPEDEYAQMDPPFAKPACRDYNGPGTRKMQAGRPRESAFIDPSSDQRVFPEASMAQLGIATWGSSPWVAVLRKRFEIYREKASYHVAFYTLSGEGWIEGGGRISPGDLTLTATGSSTATGAANGRRSGSIFGGPAGSRRRKARLETRKAHVLNREAPGGGCSEESFPRKCALRPARLRELLRLLRGWGGTGWQAS